MDIEPTDDSRTYLEERVAALHEALGKRLDQPLCLVPSDNRHATLLFFPRLERAERDDGWFAVERGVAEGAW